MADDKKTASTSKTRNTGRNARHSARKKDPVTIDLEPAKSDTARSKKAETAAAPAPAKKAPNKSAPAKKTASAVKADARSSLPVPKPAPSPNPSAADAKPKPMDAPRTADAAKSDANRTSTAASATAVKGSVPSAGAKTTPPRNDRPDEAKTSSNGPAATRAGSKAGSKGGVGAGGLIAAGLVGGAISLGGAWLLGAFDDDSSSLDALRAQLDTRIAAVESAAGNASADTLTREEVNASIEAALAANTGEGGTVEPDPRIATLTEGLTATQENLAELRTSIENAGEGAPDGTALAALAARISDMDARIGTGATAPSTQDIQAIADQAAAGQVATLSERLGGTDERLAALEGGLGQSVSRAVSSALSPMRESISEFDTRLFKTNKTVSTIETDVADLRSALDTRANELRQSARAARSELVSQLESGLAGIRSANDQQGERLGAMDQRIAAMAEQVADTDPERRAATALALANLRTRIDDGEAYGTELALVRQTNSKIDLAPLDPTASSGIATLPQLTARFDVAADRIRAAVDPAPQAGAGGLLSNLRSVVKVKPLDGSAGEGIDPTLGAIRKALDEADLAAADQAWQTLPPEGRDASQDWHQALQARMRAKNFLSEALASLLRETGG